MAHGSSNFKEGILSAMHENLNEELSGAAQEVNKIDEKVKSLKKDVDATTQSFKKMGDEAEEAGKKVRTVNKQTVATRDPSSAFEFMTESSSKNARSYLKTEETLLRELTQAWDDYNKKLTTAHNARSEATKAVATNQLKKSAEQVYKLGNSYSSLGKDVSVVSKDINKLISEMNEASKTGKATSEGFTVNKNLRSVYDLESFNKLRESMHTLAEAGYTVNDVFGKIKNAGRVDPGIEAQFNKIAKSAENARIEEEELRLEQERLKRQEREVAEAERKAAEERKSKTMFLDQESIDAFTKSLTTAVEKMAQLKSETGGTNGAFSFDETQFAQLSTLFADIESHLKSMREVFVDVGDGQEFSPLFTTLNKLEAQINSVKEAVGNIKLNMDIGSAVDNRVNTKISQTNTRRLDAYRKLFEDIKAKGKLTKRSFQYSEDEGVDANQLVGEYQALIKEIETKYGKDHIRKMFADQYKEVKNAQAAFNAATAKSPVNSISEMFKPDTSGMEAAIKGLKQDIADLVAESKQFSSSFKLDGSDGLALEKTLQAVKSISVEIVKYLSQINEKILSSASAEEVLARNAQQAAENMKAQGAVVNSQNEAVARSLMSEFGLGRSIFGSLTEELSKSGDMYSSIDKVLQLIVNKMNEASAQTSMFTEQYKQVRDFVSKSKIHIDPTFAQEFGDEWNKVRATIGTKSMVKSGGTDIQTFIDELNGALGHVVEQGTSAQDSLRNLYEFLTNNKIKNIVKIEDIREQANSAIDRALGLAEANEKIKLSAEQAREQEELLVGTLSKNGYKNPKASISPNGKVNVELTDEVDGKVQKVTTEYKNLDAVMKAIANNELLKGKGSATGVINLENYVKKLTSAMNAEYDAEIKLERAKQNNKYTKEQIALYQAEYDSLKKKTDEIIRQSEAYLEANNAVKAYEDARSNTSKKRTELEVIKNNVIKGKGESASASIDGVKELEKVYKNIFKAQSDVLRAQQANKTEAQIKPYKDRVKFLIQEKSELKKSLDLELEKLKVIDAEAKAKAKKSKDYATLNSLSNPHMDAELANVFKGQLDTVYEDISKIASSSDMLVWPSLNRINGELLALKKNAESLGIVFTEEGANFDKVQQNKKTQVENLIKAFNKLKSSIKDSDFINSGSLGKGIGAISPDVPLGTEEAYSQMKQYFEMATKISAENVKWQQSGFDLVGTFKNQAGELKKVTLSAREMGKVVRMVESDMKTLSTFDKIFNPLVNKIKQLTVYFSTFTLMMRVINSVKEGVASVKELNTALTEFQVVTKSSDSYLQSFTKNAQEAAKAVASTTSELVESATNWSRLGMLYCPFV